jgi:hypothetical protein
MGASEAQGQFVKIFTSARCLVPLVVFVPGSPRGKEDEKDERDEKDKKDEKERETENGALPISR